MRYLVISGLLMLIVTGNAFAEKMYVSNIIKVTLRTGPGTDHKVVQMLQSGNEVEVLEPGGDWSHVMATNGKEGWVLSRFLSPDMPSDRLLEALQAKYDRLQERAASLEKENAKYVEENKRLAEELAVATASLTKTSGNYEALKRESSDFLALKSKYEEATRNLEEQTKRATELNELLLQRNVKIGLLGAGILFFGFLVGFSTKKQRRRSSLL
jgi:SH3 domain protein